MAYTVVTKLISSASYKLKSSHTMVPQYITIHNTYNDASALNEIAYMTRNTSATSYHVAVDDKHVIQAIPFNRNAWHCGDGQGTGNRKSIGIEICYSKSGGPKYTAAEANAVEYIAYLLKQYGWGIDRVKWHRDWSGKNCPHRILGEGRAQSFKDRIVQQLKELNAPPKKEEKYLNIPDWQKEETAKIYKLAREKGVFSSADHERNIVDGKMTHDQAIFLMTAIAGAALNGGKRVG